MRRVGLLKVVAVFLSIPLTVATADLTADPSGDIIAPDGLSGHIIYQRVVQHRLRSFEFTAALTAGDSHWESGEMRFSVRWKDFGGVDGVNSKTIVRLTHPFDLKHGGYFLQDNEGGPNDEFAYLSAFRRIFRFPLRGVGLYGTDFNISDVVPQEAHDFHYRRVADDHVGELPVYVVELYPEAHAESEHSRILIAVEKAREVVLRARYWNKAGVETKELSLPPERFERFDDSWFPMQATMRSLLTGSYATLRVIEFEANPKFGRRHFDLGRLESK